jgi:outer membrane protein OmpA-like peptidoglycan-associated protein
MIGEIDRLNGALSECESREPQVVEKIVEVPATTEVYGQWVVQFAQNSFELTNEAKALLDTIGEDIIVDVIGTASPEGSKEYNQKLSEKRAETVANYLTNRGIRVNSWEGKGVQIGTATNRLAIVTAAQ